MTVAARVLLVVAAVDIMLAPAAASFAVLEFWWNPLVRSGHFEDPRLAPLLPVCRWSLLFALLATAFPCDVAARRLLGLAGRPGLGR